VSVTHWIKDGFHSAKHETQVAQSEPLIPGIFSNLPLKASSGQYAERIHALGRNIQQTEQSALAAWITTTKPPHLTNADWHYLMNEVMDVLCHQTCPLPTWSDVLIAITRGKDNDPALRDYALQHLVDWVQPVGLGEPCEVDPVKRQAIITTLLDAAKETHEQYSGTALQGLHLILLGRQRSEQQKEPAALLPLLLTVEQLHPLAVNLATDGAAINTARMTAIQVCAQRGFNEILPTARCIAGDQKQPFILRLSAIAAIGQMGNAGDESLLKKLQEERNPRFFRALQTAFKKINEQAITAENATPR